GTRGGGLPGRPHRHDPVLHRRLLLRPAPRSRRGGRHLESGDRGARTAALGRAGRNRGRTGVSDAHDGTRDPLLQGRRARGVL
ncbi:MAG: hypothetical protein AVDCRST_MAG53-233, partial [uncultured Solirubrobacteraceae bacterium]